MRKHFSNTQSANSTLKLHEEDILHVFKYLRDDPKTLVACRQTCKQWKEFSERDDINKVIKQGEKAYEYAKILLTEMLEYTGLKKINMGTFDSKNILGNFRFYISIERQGKIAWIGSADAPKKSYIIRKREKISGDMGFSIGCNIVRATQGTRHIQMSINDKRKIPPFSNKS